MRSYHNSSSLQSIAYGLLYCRCAADCQVELHSALTSALVYCVKRITPYQRRIRDVALDLSPAIVE